MSKLPATIRDVARVSELSVASVSRVLNGHNNVHPDTRQKVLDAMQALGYSPNAAARSLSTAKAHAIGVVLPDLHGEFFSELMRGMDQAASKRGYMLLMSNMHADSLLAGQAMGAMRGRVDGLIVMAPQLSAQDLARTLPIGLPAVLINSPDDAGHHNLRIDNRGGNSGLRQSAAELALELTGQFCRQVDGRDRLKAPDQEILAAPAAGGFSAPAARGTVEQIGGAIAVTPGRTGGAGEAFERSLVNRQERRRMGDAEPGLIAGIGADEPPGAVGDGNASVGPVNRRDGHRPVGQGKRLGLFGRGAAAQGQHHAAQRDEAAGEAEHHQQFVGDEPQYGRAYCKGRRNYSTIGQL